MKRMLSTLIASTQMLVTIPIGMAAGDIDMNAIEEKCRLQIGADKTTGSQSFIRAETGFEVLETQSAIVFRLRRCINRQRKEAENQLSHEMKLMRQDQYFWKNYDAAQQILKRSEEAQKWNLRKQVQRRNTNVGTNIQADRQKLIDARSANRETIRRKEIESRQTSNSRELSVSDARKKCAELLGTDRRACIRMTINDTGESN